MLIYNQREWITEIWEKLNLNIIKFSKMLKSLNYKQWD